MKYIVSADWHLRMYNDQEVDNNGIPKKLDEILKTIQQMLDYATNNNISEFIFLGDLNDRKSVMDTRAFVLLKKLLDCYSNIKFHFLSGNHDITSGVFNKESSVELFTSQNINTYTDIYEYNNILFSPFNNTMLDDIKNYNGKCKILCSHFGLSDAQLSNGMSIRTSVSSGDLTKFRLVLLGHYHKPQEIINTNTKIYYCGSPIQLRRDEANEEKRFLILDDDNFTVESVKTEGYRRYINIVINSIKDIDTVLNDNMRCDDYIRVETKSPEVITQLNKIDKNVLILDKTEVSPRKYRGITNSMNIYDQMEKYASLKGVDVETYMKFAKECIDNVKETEQI